MPGFRPFRSWSAGLRLPQNPPCSLQLFPPNRCEFTATANFPTNPLQKNGPVTPEKKFKNVEGVFGKWQKSTEREAQHAAPVGATPSTVCAKIYLHCHRPLEPIRNRFAPVFALQSHISRVLQRLLQETMQLPLRPTDLRKTRVARPYIIILHYLSCRKRPQQLRHRAYHICALSLHICTCALQFTHKMMPAAADRTDLRAKYMAEFVPFLGAQLLQQVEDSHHKYGEEVTEIVKSQHAQVAGAVCVCCSLPPSPYILHHRI